MKDLPQFYTSYFGNRLLNDHDHRLVSIANFDPKHPIPYVIEARISHLAPPIKLMHQVKLQNMPESEFKPAYLEYLETLEPDQVCLALSSFFIEGDERPVILLCHESLRHSTEFCHRRMLAEWLDVKLELIIPEFPKPMLKKR